MDHILCPMDWRRPIFGMQVNSERKDEYFFRVSPFETQGIPKVSLDEY